MQSIWLKWNKSIVDWKKINVSWLQMNLCEVSMIEMK